MILSSSQTLELLKIIEGNQAIVIATEIGVDFLRPEEKALLKNHGIDIESDLAAIKQSVGSIDLSFHFGMLAQAIGAMEAGKIDYNSLKEYVKGGNYIPVSKLQQATLNSIKTQTFASVKTLNGKIFSDVNNIVTKSGFSSQEEFLVHETKDGISNSKTVRQIANTISEKTGDWNRDFDRIIETANQNAFEFGKASEIERKNPGKDPLVYKRVFESACKYCIKAYLTNGIGSQPKIFKLSELKANGDNIGRKAAEWLPVIATIHPYCRCTLFEKQEGFIWNTETQSFSTPDPNWKPTLINRKPIKVKIGDKEFYV